MISRPEQDKEISAVETCVKNGVTLFAVQERLTLSSSFDSLSQLVQGAIEQGSINIAFSFTGDSYLNTRLVAHLVHFWKLVRDRGGSMGLVNPNRDICEVLETIGLAGFIRIYASAADVSAA